MDAPTTDWLTILLPYADARQAEHLKALQEHGTRTKAAKALGCDEASVRRTIRTVEKRAAIKLPQLHSFKAPEGYQLRGVSTLVDADGNVSQQWIKTAKERDNPQAVLDAFTAAVQDRAIAPAQRIPLNISDRAADRIAVYPMGDPHLGMLSWAQETGEDFDIKIAEKNLVAAVDHLVGLAPDCREALVINLGDFFHSDNSSARTMRSNAPLDVDSRWSKILQIGIRTMTRCIDSALRKHTRVRVINEIGNHDDHSAIMLSICLANYYRNNSRVQIDQSPSPYHYHEFGACLFGVTHGHLCKPDKLPGIMAVDQREAWGRTKFRHWYTGHVHHERVMEFLGCTFESMRTLAAKDAWTHASGYRSGRSMVCDVWHRDHGRVLRHEVGVEAL